MATIARRIMERWVDERGQGMTEYALLLSLVALVVLGALRTIGATAFGFFQDLIARFP